MIFGIARIALGYTLACLVAAGAQLGFAWPFDPHGLASPLANPLASPLPIPIETFRDLVFLAVHSAVFASPFAAIAIGAAEWQKITGWTYYALAGAIIALGGFIAQASGELAGEPTILNPYALCAFLLTGVIAGGTYWLAAGHYRCVDRSLRTTDIPPVLDNTPMPSEG